MKVFKNIKVASDGSCSFSNTVGVLLIHKIVIFQKQDDKNCSFNKKKSQSKLDSKQSFYYKRKYLK